MTDSTASRYRYLPTLLIILGLSWLASPAALADETGSTADQQRLEWNFKVYLDDSPIGFHRFSLSGDQQQRQLVTEADFQVKFLFITAYRYQHQNTETWQGDCLERLESRTDANGNVISWGSAGRHQFRGSRKSTAYAAQVVCSEAAKLAMAHGLKDVSVRVKGPGMGRDSAIRALQVLGLSVTSILDTTPIPHNGCRPPKRRRV